MGIHVTDPEGGRVSLGTAFRRTWGVLLFGEGLWIPFFSLWRLIRSYMDAENGLELPWDRDAPVLIRDGRLWRRVLLAGGFVVVLLLQGLLLARSYMPLNMGELTPGEYAQNVNRYFAYNLEDTMAGFELDRDGGWIDTSDRASDVDYGDMFREFFGVEFVPAPVELTVRDGCVAGIRWTQSLRAPAAPVLLPGFVEALACSLAGSRSWNIFGLDSLETLASLETLSGFSITWGGFTVVCDASREGDVYTVDLTVERAD